MFTSQVTLGAAQEYYTLLKKAVVEQGRPPESVAVLPGLVYTLGSTQEEARRRLDELNALAPPVDQLVAFAGWIGVDPGVLELDEPFPLHELRDTGDTYGSVGFDRSARLYLDANRHKTVRELVAEGPVGHWKVVGTPEQVADALEEWYRGGAADGFNLMADAYPDGSRAVRRPRRPDPAAARTVPPRVRDHDPARSLRLEGRLAVVTDIEPVEPGGPPPGASEARADLQRRALRVLTMGQVVGAAALGAAITVGIYVVEDIVGVGTPWLGVTTAAVTLGSGTMAQLLSQVMRRRGRRVGMQLGYGLAVIGSLIAASASRLSALVGLPRRAHPLRGGFGHEPARPLCRDGPRGARAGRARRWAGSSSPPPSARSSVRAW